MNEIRAFEQHEVLGHTFGIYGTENEPLFLAKDVAEWIEYDTSSIHKMLATVEEVEKVRNIIPTLGGNQEAWLLTEEGLYEVLMQSRKPIAKQFKREVKVILKSIRKHGIYATPQTIEQMLEDPDAMISVLTALKAERQQRASLEAKVELDKPFTSFARTIANSSAAILVGDFAKLVCNSEDIRIGRNRLFRWLRENGYITHDNKPYQRYVEQGLLEVRESLVSTIKGELIKTTTLVTGKGQMVLLDALQREFGVTA
jgi:Prophage antirepressor